jgi:hypothetical protein
MAARLWISACPSTAIDCAHGTHTYRIGAHGNTPTRLRERQPHLPDRRVHQHGDRLKRAAPTSEAENADPAASGPAGADPVVG